MSDSHTTPKKVLIIGGHGKVGQLTTSRLIAAGMDVTSLIRNPDQAPDVEALGATLIRDLTGLGADDHDPAARLRRDHLTAGNAGKDGASATYAIDRDGALTCTTHWRSCVRSAPTAAHGNRQTPCPASTRGLLLPYADLGRCGLPPAGLRLSSILAPARLTLEPAGGLAVVDNARPSDDSVTTSRELVAMVLVEMAGREELPQSRILPFIDAPGGGNAGETAISRL